LRTAGLTTLRKGFVRRMRTDVATLARFRSSLTKGESTAQDLEQLAAFAHALAGSSGIFGFDEVSQAAAKLEATANDELAGSRASGQIESNIDVLLECIDSASPNP